MNAFAEATKLEMDRWHDDHRAVGYQRESSTTWGERFIRPRNENVLIELERPEALYTGLLVMPDNLQADVMGVRTARVLGVGPGAYAKNSSERVPIPLEPGDRVLIDEIPTRGAWLVVGDDRLLVPWYQILGVVE